MGVYYKVIHIHISIWLKNLLSTKPILWPISQCLRLVDCCYLEMVWSSPNLLHYETLSVYVHRHAPPRAYRPRRALVRHQQIRVQHGTHGVRGYHFRCLLLISAWYATSCSWLTLIIIISLLIPIESCNSNVIPQRVAGLQHPVRYVYDLNHRYFYSSRWSCRQTICCCPVACPASEGAHQYKQWQEFNKTAETREKRTDMFCSEILRATTECRYCSRDDNVSRRTSHRRWTS